MMDDSISRQAAIDEILEWKTRMTTQGLADRIAMLPTVQLERKRGKWILDRSGAYCCSECMEPCASYVMMRPRDKFCKMCGAKMEGDAE